MRNLIINSSFESDLGSWIGYREEAMYVTEEQSHSGTKSLKFVAGLLANGAFPTGGGGCRLYNDVDIEPNTEYIFSFWVNTSNGYKVELVDYNTNKLIVSYSNSQLNTNGQWEQICEEFYSNETITLSIEVTTDCVTTADMYYDDFVLYSKSEPIRIQTYPSVTSFSEGYIIPKCESKLEGCKEGKNLVSDLQSEDFQYWATDSEGYGKFAQIVKKSEDIGSELKLEGEGVYTKWLNVEPYTRYCFTFNGRIDTSKFSDLEIQLVTSDGLPLSMGAYKHNVFSRLCIPGQDGFWHERTLYVCIRAAKKIGIRFKSTKGTAYFNKIEFYNQEDIVVKKAFAGSTGNEFIVTDNGKICVCQNDKNLIASFNEKDILWTLPKGFGDFIDFAQIKETVALHYTEKFLDYYYMTKIPVKPYTEYVFTYYANILKQGKGAYGLLDGDANRTAIGVLHNIDETDEKIGWKHHTVRFKTGDSDCIYFAVYDGGGEALFANLRLFEEKNTLLIEFSKDCPAKPELVKATEIRNKEFINGILIPWFYSSAYGCDIGAGYSSDYTVCKFDEGHVRAELWNAKVMGFNMVKLWLCEKVEGIIFDDEGHVLGVDKEYKENFKRVLDIAQEYGLTLALTLVPHFDLCTNESLVYARVMRFVQNPDITQEYLKNWLTPILDLVNNYSNIGLIEIYGEAEGDTDNSNWRLDRGTTWNGMIRFVKTVFAFIKRKYPQYKITVSSGNYYDSLTQFYNPMELDFIGTDIYNITGRLKDPKMLKLNAPILLGEYGGSENPTLFTKEEELFDLAKAFVENSKELGYAGIFLWHAVNHLREGVRLYTEDGNIRPHAAYYRFYALDELYKTIGVQKDQPAIVCNTALVGNKISWFGSRAAEFYELERSDDGKNWCTVAKVSQKCCEKEGMLLFSCCDNNAINDRKYNYRVTAFIDGEAIVSDVSPKITIGY